jgi:hypothetical protein
MIQHTYGINHITNNLHRNELEFTYEFISNFHGKIGKLLTTTQHNNPPSHENNDAYVIYWTPLTPQVQNAIYFGMATVELKRQKNPEVEPHRQ